MGRIKIAFWGSLALLAGLWLIVNPTILQTVGIFPLRDPMLQLTGVLAMGCMSIATILSARPRWPEPWLGGLDKMYRLHKWLGIGGLVLAVSHWLWVEGPKWAVGWGLVERPVRGERPPVVGVVEPLLRSFRGMAEGVGEWAFYATVVLVIVALVRWIPYRVFAKVHRLMAVLYLTLVFHSVVLLRFNNWLTPIGVLMAVLMAFGTFAAFLSLFGRIGADCKARATITSLQYYPEVKVLEGELDVTQGWAGHKAGQFAFVSGEQTREPHPFTIASSWDPAEHRLTFITKELGDFTSTLRDRLAVGQKVTVEGPYGCFTFEDRQPCQIWIAGGIGISPFIARMKQIARERLKDHCPAQDIHLFYAASRLSEAALAKLTADAEAAGVHLHINYDRRDDYLTGERIRDMVPGWREASIWFCGPVGFGKAIRQSFARQGFDAAKRFHQELFDMR